MCVAEHTLCFRKMGDGGVEECRRGLHGGEGGTAREGKEQEEGA